MLIINLKSSLYQNTILALILSISSVLCFSISVYSYPSSLYFHYFNLVLGSIFITYSLFTFCNLLSFKTATEILLSLLLLGVLILLCSLSTLPPSARDELNQHLALPKLYATEGKIVEIPFATYTYYPMLINIYYIGWIILGLDWIPKLIQTAFALATSSLVIGFITSKLNKTYGLLGGLILLTTPILVRTGTSAYVDLALTFYCTTAVLAFLKYIEVSDLRWLAASVALAGSAAAIKPNGAMIVLILGIIWLLVELKKKPLSQVKLSAGIFFFLILSGLFCMPWFIKNYLATSNPFYPFLNSFFIDTVKENSELVAVYQSIDGLSRRFLIYGENIWQVLALPLRIFLFGKDDSPREFDGILNPIFLLFIPFIFKLKKEHLILFLFSVSYLLVTIFFTVMRVRYILPIIPIITILTVFGIERAIKKSSWASKLVLLITVLCLALNLSYMVGYFNKFSPLKYLSGSESRDSYLTRILPDYSSLSYINRILPYDAKIYLVLTGRQGYYLDRDYYFDREELPEIIFNSLKKNGSSEMLLANLKELGITHIMLRNDLFIRFVNDNFNLVEVQQWNSFARNSLKSLYQNKFYTVYQIKNNS